MNKHIRVALDQLAAERRVLVLRISRIDDASRLIMGLDTPVPSATIPDTIVKNRRRSKFTAAQRRRLSEAMKRRWAIARAMGTTPMTKNNITIINKR